VREVVACDVAFPVLGEIVVLDLAQRVVAISLWISCIAHRALVG